MSYIEKSLGEGERIVALARFHWWYTAISYISLLVPGLILGFAIISRLPDAILYSALALFALGLAIFLSRMIVKWTTEIGVTSHRFVKKRGLFTLHTDEFALSNIEGVRVNQSFWGRIWDYGRLRIEGTGDDAFEIPNIADPVGFRRAIETAKSLK